MMKGETINRISSFLRFVLLTGALLYIAAYLLIAFSRVQYPFELQPSEGNSLEHVRRILAGRKIYVSPSLEFVPFIYTPLYFYLSAGVARVAGHGFTALRLVSLVSSLGSFLLIFLIVRRETREKLPAVLASCLFAATYRMCGEWFDIARVDSLFLFLLLAAMYLIRFKTSPLSYVLAGVLVSLSFLTKQTALAISLPLMIYSVYSCRRRSLYFIGTLVAVAGLSTLLLDGIHDGWYGYYVFGLPRQHAIAGKMLVLFWTRDILPPLAVACTVSVFYLLSRLSRPDRGDIIFYSLVAAGMIGVSWLAKLNRGAGPNVLLPACAIISILFGLGTHAALELIRGAPEKRRKLMEVYVYLVCVVQFAVLAYNPLPQIPSRRDLEAGWELVAAIREIQGDVFIPHHGYLAVLAGKNGCAHPGTLAELLGVFGGEETEEGARVIGEMKRAISAGRYAAIILDYDWHKKDVEEHYIMLRPAFSDGDVFWPVTGGRRRPEYIYVPRGSDNDV